MKAARFSPAGKKLTCRLRLLTKPAGAASTVSFNGNDLGPGIVAHDEFREFAVWPTHSTPPLQADGERGA